MAALLRSSIGKAARHALSSEGPLSAHRPRPHWRLLQTGHTADSTGQGKLVQGVDAYLQRPTFYNDQGKVNRVLTFCRVPKGERREKLIWRSSLAIFFVASWAIGQWETSRCMEYYNKYQKKQGEENVNHAA